MVNFIKYRMIDLISVRLGSVSFAQRFFHQDSFRYLQVINLPKIIPISYIQLCTELSLFKPRIHLSDRKTLWSVIIWWSIITWWDIIWWSNNVYIEMGRSLENHNDWQRNPDLGLWVSHLGRYKHYQDINFLLKNICFHSLWNY